MNNEEVINILIKRGHNVEKINCENFLPSYIENNKHKKFIIANFAKLRYNETLLNSDYIIYEHDHKYLTTRNPGVFENFIAPKEAIVNIPLYENAKAVLCQSKFHVDIMNLNTKLSNIINLGGNVWDMESIELMRELSKQEKKRFLCNYG